MNYKDTPLEGYLNFLTTQDLDPLILTKESYQIHEKRVVIYRTIFFFISMFFFILASFIYFKTHQQILKDEISLFSVILGCVSLLIGSFLHVEKEIVYSTSFQARRRAHYCLDTEHKIQLIQKKKTETLFMLKKIDNTPALPKNEKHDLTFYLLEQFSLYLSNLVK